MGPWTAGRRTPASCACAAGTAIAANAFAARRARSVACAFAGRYSLSILSRAGRDALRPAIVMGANGDPRVRADAARRMRRTFPLLGARRRLLLNGLFLGLGRLCGVGRALQLGFFRGLAGGRFFLGLALLLLGGAQFFLGAKTRVFDLAFALFDVLALASLDQSAGARIDLAGRELAQNFLLALVGRVFGLLEGAMLGLRRRGLRLLGLLSQGA